MTYLVLAALAVAGIMLWLNRKLSKKIGALEEEIKGYDKVLESIGKSHEVDIKNDAIPVRDKRQWLLDNAQE